MLEEATGKLTERRLDHQGGRADAFYRNLRGPVRVGDRSDRADSLVRALARGTWSRSAPVKCAGRATLRLFDLRRDWFGALAGFGYGFGYGVVWRNLEEREVGLGALDLLHGDGGFHAGLGVAGDG